VRGANGCRGNALPFAHVPERVQIAKDVLDEGGLPASVVVPVGSQETWDVLHEDVAGSKIANGAGELGPEPALVSATSSPSGDAGRGAGEAAGDEVDPRQRREVDVADVGMLNGPREALGEQGAPEVVSLDLPCRSPARPLKAKVEQPDA